MAKKMRDSGLAINDIAKFTGLGEAEVEMLLKL